MFEDKSQAEYNIRDFPKRNTAIRNFGQNGVVYFCEFHHWTMGMEALGFLITRGRHIVVFQTRRGFGLLENLQITV